MAQQNIYDMLNENIKKMIEPLPTEDLLKKIPEYKDLFHKPDFLLVKVSK